MAELRPQADTLPEVAPRLKTLTRAQQFAEKRELTVRLREQGHLLPDGRNTLAFLRRLAAAIETLKAWGLTFKGAGAWGKRTSTNAHWAFGRGYIMRSVAEFYLIGTRGKPPRLSASVRNFIEAPVREHSRKSGQIRAEVEALWAGPRLERFARQAALGWSCFGNETDKFAPEGAAPLSAEQPAK